MSTAPSQLRSSAGVPTDPHMQPYQTLLLFCNLCSLAIICFLLCEALSQARTHAHTHRKKNMEMLLGQLPPVAMTQYTSSVTAHLESREEQQEQEDGEK